MLPKKPKDFVKPTADKLGLDEAFIRDAVDFYWKEVRKTLSDLKAPRVAVAKFGYFQLKFWALEDQKKTYEEFLSNIDPDNMTFMRHTLKEDITKRLDSVNKVLEIVQKDQAKKKKVKEKRNAKKTKDNLEESQGDTPGDKEQLV